MSEYLIQKLEKIDSRLDLAEFVAMLKADLDLNEEKWENKTLPHFLEALSSWIEDCDGYFMNKNLAIEDMSPWKLMAMMLSAAKVYE